MKIFIENHCYLKPIFSLKNQAEILICLRNIKNGREYNGNKDLLISHLELQTKFKEWQTINRICRPCFKQAVWEPYFKPTSQLYLFQFQQWEIEYFKIMTFEWGKLVFSFFFTFLSLSYCCVVDFLHYLLILGREGYAQVALSAHAQFLWMLTQQVLKLCVTEL